MNSPWIINIENGDCDQNHKTNHDVNSKLSFFMSETEFIHFVRAMKNMIDVFIYTFGSHLFLKGYNKSREAEKQNREQYNQQKGNGNYQTNESIPQQQYNPPSNNSAYNYPPQSAQAQPPVQQQPPAQQPVPAYSNPPGWN